MTFKDRIFRLGITLIINGPAARQGLAGLEANLKKTQQELQTKLRSVSETTLAKETLRHIIAMERWGQKRLKVALGEPYIQDENHAYKPDEASSWEDLKRAFAETRAQTLETAKQLRESGTDLKQTIPHNQFGPLTVLGWLRYLNTHAALEAKRKLR